MVSFINAYCSRSSDDRSSEKLVHEDPAKLDLERELLRYNIHEFYPKEEEAEVEDFEDVEKCENVHSSLNCLMVLNVGFVATSTAK